MPANSKIKLYNYFRSSASFRVRIALHLKNIPFEYIPIHLLNHGGEQYRSDYKTLNPMSQVPCLVLEENGRQIVINQSVAIIEYLDEKFPSPKLYPNDSYKKSLVRQFVEGINSMAQPMGNLAVLNFLEKEFKLSSADKDKWIHHWTKKSLTALENLATEHGGAFLIGDELTAAELFLVPQLFTARRFNCPLEGYPRLLAVEKKCLEMDAFVKAHPTKQVDFV